MAKQAFGKFSLPELNLKETFHPFGRGNLASNGVQYSTPATSVLNAAVDVEAVTIALPVDGAIKELELGITWRQKCSGTVDGAVGKVQGRNSGGTWIDLMTAATNTTVGTTNQEFTYSGYIAPVTGFNAVPFDLKVITYSSGTTDNAIAQVKNSSFVTVICDPR